MDMIKVDVEKDSLDDEMHQTLFCDVEIHLDGEIEVKFRAILSRYI